MAKLNVKCHVCKKTKVVNGQRQFDTWKRSHKHLNKQSESKWKTGTSFSFKYV